MNFKDVETSRNRDDWEFEYTASTLAVAAMEKKEYRQGRADWWLSQQESLMKEVRDSGLEITESVASLYASSATNGPQLNIRQDLKGKLAECHTKIREHLAAVREYDGWVQVLSNNPDSRLKLKHGDWLFFFGSN
jgi:histidinol-phosphate/aromatic aminotransferase/cobyric acid decarboxylase-like protein